MSMACRRNKGACSRDQRSFLRGGCFFVSWASVATHAVSPSCWAMVINSARSRSPASGRGDLGVVTVLDVLRTDLVLPARPSSSTDRSGPQEQRWTGREPGVGLLRLACVLRARRQPGKRLLVTSESDGRPPAVSRAAL